MNSVPPHRRHPDEIAAAAAAWALRRDRGLTAAEQDELSQWLAADARHGAALAQQRWGWEELDRLAGLQTSLAARPDPDLLAPRTGAKSALIRRWWWLAPLVLATAATVIGGLYWRASPPMPAGRAVPAPATALAAPCERRTLEDGSVVELNRGAAIEAAFTETERHVRLVRGEANFTVTKNPARPFIVSAGGVDVRAVGTVFNVRLDHTAVEVVVSEGRVRVAPPAPAGTPARVETLLSVGQSAVVPLAAAAPPPQVVTLTTVELESRLAWQPRLLDFTAAPLAEIVADFNRRNPVQLVVADPALAALRLSAAFRSDNVEGFVRLMESDFGMKAEWRGEKEIALTRAK